MTQKKLGGGGANFQNYDFFFREGSFKIRYGSIWGRGVSKKAKKGPTSFMDGPKERASQGLTVL